MAKTSTHKVKFKINKDNLPNLVSSLTELSKISENIKFKIDKDHILAYSLVGETIILAFKNYLFNTRDYFIFDDPDFDYTMDYIVINSKRFVKNLAFFKEDVKMTMTYKDSPKENLKYVRSLTGTDGRFKMNNIGGEPFKVKEIDKFKLNQLLNPANAEWSFQINDSDFKDIKKLSSINGDDRIITISTNNGKLNFGETGIWDLIVTDINDTHDDVTFPKKYLGNITNTTDVLNFSVFETFLLFKDDNSNFMVSFEQSFNEDDDY